MLKTLKIELIKIKGSYLFLVATFFPILAIMQGFSMVRNLTKNEMLHFWEALFSGSILLYGMIILPLLIAIIFAIIARIEYKENSWKQVLTHPIRREHVYAAKLILGCGIILYNLVVLSVGILLIGILLEAKGPIPWNIIVLRPLLAFIAALPIISIQFYISIRFKNVGIPLGVGALFSLPVILVANSTKYWIFYPWTYPMLTLMPNFITSVEQTLKYGIMYSISILSFMIIIGLGLYQFKRKDIT